MNFLNVFDYSNCTLIEIQVTEEQCAEYGEDTEKLLRVLDLNPNQCSWMWSDHALSRDRAAIDDKSDEKPALLWI